MAFQFTTPLRWARMNHIKPKKFWVEPGDVLGETQIGSVPGQEVGLWDVRLSDNQMNKLSQKETRAFHHGNRRVSLQPSGAAAKALTRATAPRLPFSPPHSGRGNPRQPSWRAKRKADDKAKWMRAFVAGLEKQGVTAHAYTDFNWSSPEHLYNQGVSPQDAALRIGPRYVVPEGRWNPSMQSRAMLVRRVNQIVEAAQRDLGYDLAGFSMLDLVADNIEGVSLADLRQALADAGYSVPPLPGQRETPFQKRTREREAALERMRGRPRNRGNPSSSLDWYDSDG